MKGKYRRAVFVVAYAKIPRGIEYLILKRKLHWKGWEFPKGGIERFEIGRFSIKRELKEETGLSPIKIKKFSEKGKYKYDKKYSDRREFIGQSYKLYSAEVKYSKKIKLDKIEHKGYKWAGFKTAVKMLTWKNQKKCLKIVNDYLGN